MIVAGRLLVCSPRRAPPSSPQVRGNHDWPGAEFPRSKATYAVRPQLLEVCLIAYDCVRLRTIASDCVRRPAALIEVCLIAHRHRALRMQVLSTALPPSFPTGVRLAHRHRALLTRPLKGAVAAVRRACDACNHHLESNLPLMKVVIASFIRITSFIRIASFIVIASFIRCLREACSISATTATAQAAASFAICSRRASSSLASGSVATSMKALGALIAC